MTPGNRRGLDLLGHHAGRRSSPRPVDLSSGAKALDDPLRASRGPDLAVGARSPALSTPSARRTPRNGNGPCTSILRSQSRLDDRARLLAAPRRGTSRLAGRRVARATAPTGSIRSFPRLEPIGVESIPDRSAFAVRETGRADSIRCPIPIRSVTSRLWNRGEVFRKNL